MMSLEKIMSELNVTSVNEVVGGLRRTRTRTRTRSRTRTRTRTRTRRRWPF